MKQDPLRHSVLLTVIVLAAGTIVWYQSRTIEVPPKQTHANTSSSRPASDAASRASSGSAAPTEKESDDTDRKQISKMLDLAKTYLESGAWDKYMDFFVDGYKFAGRSRDGYRRILEAMAAVGFKCNFTKAEIMIDKDTASVYPLIVEFVGVDSDAMLARLDLKKIEGTWRITSAIQDLSDADDLPDVVDYSGSAANAPTAQF